jgi:DNA-binding CsgD family transcriptional regulator
VTEAPPARSAAAWVRAGIAAALGRLDAARAELASARATDERTGRLTVLPQLLARLVDVELRAERPSHAAAHLDALDEATALVDSPWARCLAARARATVEGDAALARAAGDVADEAGLRYEAALSELVAAELDPTATDELRHAHDELRALGAEPARRRAASALRARGQAVPRSRAEPATGLTPTECQLARLVTEGMTNKEIANALFLSPKTVEVYLSRLYAKVECASRVELAVAVQSGALEIDAP